MKMVVKYLNFVFHIEVKIKSNYKILNFVFQLIKTQNGTLVTQILNPYVPNFNNHITANDNGMF